MQSRYIISWQCSVHELEQARLAELLSSPQCLHTGHVWEYPVPGLEVEVLSLYVQMCTGHTSPCCGFVSLPALHWHLQE